MLCFLLFIVPSCACYVAVAQDKGTILGIVYDERGEPLPGASISIDGSLLGTLSSDDGSFSFGEVNGGSYEVRVSFVGYDTRVVHVEVAGTTKLDVALVRSSVVTQEVVVNAVRAGDRAPLAYSMISGELIKKMNVGQDIPFLLSMTPSVVETSESGNGIGYTDLRIRGTDANRINITIDGIPLNDPESQKVFWVNIPDIASSIDNIQVQRGVGSSSNGPAAFGATVSMNTKALENDPFGKASLSFGSFNTFKVMAAAGSGLIKDRFAIQMRVSKLKSDGYVYRTGSDHYSAYVSTMFRMRDAILKANVILGKEHTGIGWWGNPIETVDLDRRYNPAGEFFDDDGNLHYYNNESDNYQQNHYQLIFNQKVNDKVILNAALFYTHGQGYYEEYKDDDAIADYGVADGFFGNSFANTDLIRQKWMSNDYFGAIFSTKYDITSIFDITFGANVNYFFGDHFGKIIWMERASVPEMDYRWHFNSGDKGEISSFIKTNYLISKKLSIYGDVQYRFVNYLMKGSDDDLKPLDQEHSFNFFNPKVGLFYSVNSKNELYLSFAVANREPTRSDYKEAAGDVDANPEAETLYDTELGYSFKSDKFALKANAYAMIYDDQLVPTGELSNVGYSIMTNVDDSYRLGIELNTSFTIASFIKWDLGTTLSENRILNHVEYYVNYLSDGTERYESKSVGDVNIAYSPAVIASSDVTLLPFKGTEIHLTSKYVGKQYFDNSMSEERTIKPYFVNNIRFDYTLNLKKIEALGFQLQINNIFNSKYESNAYGGYYLTDGEESTWAYYFPQAGTNVMIKLDVSF